MGNSAAGTPPEEATADEPAFGQLGPGRIDLRVFDEQPGPVEEMVWLDRHGVAHKLLDLDAGYVAAIMAFLLDSVDYLYFQLLRRSFVDMLSQATEGRFSADVIASALGAAPLTAFTPEAWLRSTALWRRLAELAAPNASR
jgi:hypothetical protein